MALSVQSISTPSLTDPNGYNPTAEAARNTFAQQAQLIAADLAKGHNPYGGQQNAINSLYNTYGRNSGLSYQEAAGIIGQAYAPKGQTAPAQAAAVSPGTDPALTAQAIDNINQAIGRLGDQQNSGNSAIDSSLGTALQTLLQGKNQANQTYDQNVQADKSGYIQGKNTIGANAGASLTGLLRLLGSRGAGGGTAYNVVAPGAVDRQASLQRTDLSNTFGANERNLNQNWGTYLQGYNDQVNQANTSAQQKKLDLQNQIETNRASLLQTLAGLQSSASAAQPILNQANSLLNNAANFQTLPINVTTPAYQAPSTASYTTNPNAAPTFQGQGAANDYTSPYLQALLGKKAPAAVGA